MGFYARYILPRLIELAIRNKELSRLRAEWVSRASGDVLEVGIGSGLNLPFYSSQVHRVYGVDPSIELQRIARERTAVPFGVDFLTQPAEMPLPLADNTIDTAVVTWTLYSIADPAKALHEVRRVLKPTGHLLFVEHGYAPDPEVAVCQSRLTPVWKRVAGGCHLNRRTDSLIAAAGFQFAELRREYLPGLRPMMYTYQGIAVPGSS